jgi:hypothetical protein
MPTVLRVYMPAGLLIYMLTVLFVYMPTVLFIYMPTLLLANYMPAILFFLHSHYITCLYAKCSECLHADCIIHHISSEENSNSKLNTINFFQILNFGVRILHGRNYQYQYFGLEFSVEEITNIRILG